MAAVTIHIDLETQENKIYHSFHIFFFYLPWSGRTGCHNFSYFNVEFKSAISYPLSPSSRDSLVPVHFLPLDWYMYIWSCWYFSWQSWLQVVIYPVWNFIWCTLHMSCISRMTIYSLVLLFLPIVTCQLFHVWLCFLLTFIQVSQETGKAWYVPGTWAPQIRRWPTCHWGRAEVSY